MSNTYHHHYHRRRYYMAPRWFTNLYLERPRRRLQKLALAHYVRGGEDPVEHGKTNCNLKWS